MGIAWFDDQAPELNEPALRTGGLPLMNQGTAWPACPRCELPMLFRGQLPLALTSLVSSDDPRVISIFECHAQSEDAECDGGDVRIHGDTLTVITPPAADAFDLWLTSLGPQPAHVLRITGALGEASERSDDEVEGGPVIVLRSAPASIAGEAERALTGAGAQTVLRPSGPTELGEMFGGALVPFDDATPGTRRTTLPPLDTLLRSARKARIRGLIGGATPGYRDHSYPCTCGKPTRTAVRLFAQRDPSPTGIVLGPAVVQVCLRCSSGAVYRSSGPPPLARPHGAWLQPLPSQAPSAPES